MKKLVYLLTIAALLFIASAAEAKSITTIPSFSGVRYQTAKSLQGLQNRSTTSKIRMDKGDYDFPWPIVYRNKWGWDIPTSPEQDTNLGLMNVINDFSSQVDGYILYDWHSNQKSLFVALSLAGPLNAVVIDDNLEALFQQEVGLPRLADVRTRDYQWLWNYHRNKFSIGGMVHPNSYYQYDAADMAVRFNWVIITSDNQIVSENFMDRLYGGAFLAGWTPMYMSGQGEDAMIEYYSGFRVNLIGGGGCIDNWSVKYNLCSPNFVPFPHPYSFNPNKHYVTLYLNSGGNINYLHNRYLTDIGNQYDSDNWMNVPHTVPLTWSLHPRTQLAPAALWEIVTRQSGDDIFMAGFSGHAYIHPSQYPYLGIYCNRLEPWLEESCMEYVAIQDPSQNPIDQSWVNTYGKKYLEIDDVQGLYVQTPPFGKVFEGYGGKPVVTRRTSMNIAGSSTNMNNFINLINSYQPNPYSEYGYTVVTVNLETTSIQDCQYFFENKASHIEVVTFDELCYHIKNNLF